MFDMKRIVFWALPLLLIGALTTQGFAQDCKPDPKWKGTEYEDYMGVYNEKDNVKKAAGAEKYFVDHKDADPIALTQIYTMGLLSYANAGNWAKTLETVERANLATCLTDAEKKRNTQIGLLAATNLKNNAKTIEYAEKVLKDDPKNLNALVTLSGVLSATMPTTAGPAQTTQIARTLDITKQALAVPKPADVQDAQWNQIQVQLHETSALMLLNQMKYPDSIAEAQAALKINSKDSYAWYLIGLNHKASLAELIKKYRALLDKYNENRTTADQIALDEMKTAYQVAEKIASDKTDETLDAFARSVAAGGPSATPAREELQKLFTGTPAELNQLIEEKKKTLTGN
jgi:hypothetical protein